MEPDQAVGQPRIRVWLCRAGPRPACAGAAGTGDRQGTLASTSRQLAAVRRQIMRIRSSNLKMIRKGQAMKIAVIGSNNK